MEGPATSNNVPFNSHAPISGVVGVTPGQLPLGQRTVVPE